MYDSPAFLIIAVSSALLLGVFCVMSVVLGYHFKKYGMNALSRIGIPMAIYYSVAALFFFAMFVFGFTAIR